MGGGAGQHQWEEEVKDAGCRILWPSQRFVPAKLLITWASDDVANGAHAGPPPKTLEEAVQILTETGTVTFEAANNMGKK